MKKSTAFGIIVGGVATGLTALNHYIFKRAEKYVQEGTRGNYRHTTGNVAYIKKGTGAPLLLVHSISIGGSSYEWTKNIDALSQHFTVYALDLIGFGESDRANSTYTAYNYAKLILCFIDDVIKEPCHIAAANTSAGFVAVAYSFCAESILSITMISPTGICDEENRISSYNKMSRQFIDSRFFGTTAYTFMSSHKSIRQFFEKNIMYDVGNVTNELVDTYYLNAHKYGIANRFAIAAFISNYLNVELTRFLPKIEVPLLMIWGKENSINTVDNLNTIKGLLKDTRTVIFSEAKSLPQYEKPAQFNKLITEFISNIK